MRIDANTHKVFMVRGDDESYTISVKDKPFTHDDIVVLTIRKVADVGAVLFQKQALIADGKAIIQFNSTDTEQIPFGVYSYDVKCTFADIGVKHLVVDSEFELGKDNSHG